MNTQIISKVPYTEGHSHFAEGLIEVFLRDRAVRTELLEGALELVSEGFEHVRTSVPNAATTNEIDGE